MNMFVWLPGEREPSSRRGVHVAGAHGSDVHPGHVAATATPLHELRVDGVAEALGERGEQVLLRVTPLAVGDEVDVRTGLRVFDRVDGVVDYGRPALGVFGRLQVP
jgi:hypothetical protein